jgi:hypothetical protein
MRMLKPPSKKKKNEEEYATRKISKQISERIQESQIRNKGREKKTTYSKTTWPPCSKRCKGNPHSGRMELEVLAKLNS